MLLPDTLLATKLNIPKLRPALIARPRLIEKLNSGLSGRLTLISAPAGFGKTTLVADWLNQLSFSTQIRKTEHCTWLSLDPLDNDPVRFLQYLVAAIQIVYPKFGVEILEILDNSPRPNIQAITQDLLNEFIRNNQPLIMVMDDYHEIQNDQIHQILQIAIDYLPPQIHFVVTTRQDPPVSLPRWRARGWLNDIIAADLRFNPAETSDFLHHTMQLDLSSEAVLMLEDRTEGWVAGLQLAALSLEDTDFSPEAIQQFGGRDRYVADYLLTEVFDHQPVEFQQFLLPTAILDRFNADLCTAILHPDAPKDNLHLTQKYQEIILSLERSNLFIVPLDRRSYWYRFHHLFAQLLRQRLEQNWTTAQIHGLYHRAANWFASHEFIEEAINYAVQGQDYAFTARLISEFEIDRLWNQTWGLKLGKWGAALPSEILQEFPKATIHIAISHMIRNDIKQAIRYVELVRENPQVLAEITLIDSIFIRNQGDLAKALDLALESTELFRGEDQTKYFAAQLQVVVCLWNLGDLPGAENLAKSLQQDIQISSGHFLNIYIQLLHVLEMINEQRGRLVEAESICQEGIKIIQQSGITLPLIGLLQARLAAIYYQWNDIEKAAEYCESGLAWGNRTGIGDILIQSLFVHVDLAIYRKDEQAFQADMDGFSKLLDWAEFSDIGAIIRAGQAVYDVRLGDWGSAVRWADSSGLSLDDQPSLRNQTEYHSLVRVRYEENRQLGMGNQALEIIPLVDRLINLLDEHEIADTAIYLWSLKALLLDLNGQGKNAISALQQALSLAYPGGFIRVFVDLGEPMHDLIQKSLAFDPHMVYKRRLLLAFADEAIDPPKSVSSNHEFPITLTPREHEILVLIAGGLSNKAIQDKLMISKNTVRTHIKNLYSKLGVSSRTQAVKQAREQRLI